MKSHFSRFNKCHKFKWQSPLAAAVMMGEKEEVIIKWQIPQRKKVVVDGWVNKTSDFNAGDWRLLVSFNHDHNVSLDSTKNLF